MSYSIEDEVGNTGEQQGLWRRGVKTLTYSQVLHIFQTTTVDAKRVLMPSLAEIALPTAVSMAAFPLLLYFSQRAIWKPSGIHAAIPSVKRHICGLGTVVFAGSVASLGFLKTRNFISANSRESTHRNKKGVGVIPIACMGIASGVTFFILGGRARHVLPSSLYHPGAFASRNGSLSAGRSYADQVERSRIQKLGRHFGCHSCGVKRASKDRGKTFIADHQPPRKLNEKKLIDSRFYPHCVSCSNIQGHNIRRCRSFLITHPLRTFRLFHIFLPFPPLIFLILRAYWDEIIYRLAATIDNIENWHEAQYSSKRINSPWFDYMKSGKQ